MAQDNRWKGRRRSSTDGYRWRKERCPYCGLHYHKEFKLKEFLGVTDTFQHYKQIIAAETAAREAENDYSSPGSRGSVLGRMFQDKQQLWQQHLEECEQVVVMVAIESGLLDLDGEIDDLYALLEDGQEIYDLLEQKGVYDE